MVIRRRQSQRAAACSVRKNPLTTYNAPNPVSVMDSADLARLPHTLTRKLPYAVVTESLVRLFPLLLVLPLPFPSWSCTFKKKSQGEGSALWCGDWST